MLRHIFALILVFNSLSAFCQKDKEKEIDNLVYYGRDYYLLEGTVIPDSLKESPFDRLPASYKDKVREPVWNLSKNSAGISVRFVSNTTNLKVKWELLNDLLMNHMAETGIKGLDLYVLIDNEWRYVNTARPKGKENKSKLFSGITPEMREYKLYLPLYDGVTSLEIGIDSTSVIQKANPNPRKPIIFYGTSITQGGCASRTGMAHTNIISRKLGVDCINFGFSGNGRMEEPINQLISEADPLFYVIECLPNMKTEMVTERTIPLVKTIREKHPETPIVFVENLIYEKAVLEVEVKKTLDEKNAALKTEYEKMLKQGYKNIYYIDNKGAIGTDHEATVDGTHFTDLGFLRFSDYLIVKFKKFKLIKPPSKNR